MQVRNDSAAMEEWKGRLSHHPKRKIYSTDRALVIKGMGFNRGNVVVLQIQRQQLEWGSNERREKKRIVFGASMSQSASLHTTRRRRHLGQAGQHALGENTEAVAFELQSGEVG